jgi:NADH-quinone oxidoreductase subunit N
MMHFFDANSSFIPELVLTLAALVLLMLSAFKKKTTPLFRILLSFSLFSALLWVLGESVTGEVFLSGRFLFDDFAKLSKILILVICSIAFAVSSLSSKPEKSEQFSLLLLIFIGAVISVSCGDLLSLFMAMELQGLGFYLLVASSIDERNRGEAALKYFILGSLGSGIFLYGASLIYGETGALLFSNIQFSLAQVAPSSMSQVGAFCLFASLFFKLSIVPFHAWTPDVFEKTPFRHLIYLATVSKLTAVLIAIRLLASGMDQLLTPYAFFSLGLLSLFIGAFGAFRQENLRRLLGYSSILNMGFVLLALGNMNHEGYTAALIYTLFYTLTTLALFAHIIHLKERGCSLHALSQLKGFAGLSTLNTVIFSVLFLSLAGIPPLTGFLGKVYVIQSLLFEEKYVVIALVAVVLSVVAASYYMRLLKIMILDAPDTGTKPLILGARRPIPTAYVMSLVGLLLLLFIYPSLITDTISSIMRTL